MGRLSPSPRPSPRWGEEVISACHGDTDIATWPWVTLHGWAGVDIDDLPNLRRWIDKVGERPAVVTGRGIPEMPKIDNAAEEIARKGQQILV